MVSDKLSYDVVIIGAGPAGLSAAIRLKQRRAELSVCLLEKGSDVGAHILSGAVFSIRALSELLPDWQNRDLPINQAVTQDRWLWLTAKRHWPLPVIKPLRNTGHFIISLGALCRALAKIAEALGVDVLPGFSATAPLFDQQHRVIGIQSGDFGIDRHHQKTAQFQPGLPIYAKQVLVAEGCRGSLTKRLITTYALDKHCCPQTFAIGLKEVWRVPHTCPGSVTHTIGWPLNKRTYGGGFIYERSDNLINLGLVVGLDYRNPWLDPFEELQRLKTHPRIAQQLRGGERLSYGAKSLVEGGYQSLPRLSFPGGLLIGDAAGFINVPQLKGSHNAMKSGMLAADTLLSQGELEVGAEYPSYETSLRQSWLGKELKQVRNIRPAFKWGLAAGLAYSAIDMLVLKGRTPWTFKHRADHLALDPAKNYAPIPYPKPDGQLTFDKLSSLQLSGVYHAENQPCHLRLKTPELPISINHADYAAAETRYCPAGVYEIITQAGQPHLQINAQNCLHCKTCDIKDLKQNITWHPPEGGGGPNYEEM